MLLEWFHIVIMQDIILDYIEQWNKYKRVSEPSPK